MLELATGFLIFCSPILTIWFFPKMINLVIGEPAKITKPDGKSVASEAAASRTSDSVDEELEAREARAVRSEPSMDGMPDPISAVVGVPVATGTAATAGAAAAIAGNVYHFSRRQPAPTSNASSANEVYPGQAQPQGNLPLEAYGAPPCDYTSRFEDDEPF